jgi:AAA15 family ATPase/GTPase
MLIEFTIGNFLSFKDPTTLSMVAAKLNSRDRSIDKNNIIPVNEKISLLTSAAIYGANASGKSNLVRSMSFMRRFILNSSKSSQVDEPIKVSPFRLSTESEGKPTFFQVLFLLDGIEHRYGFEVDRMKVISEWLFYASSSKESRLFIRDNNEIKISREFKEGRGLEDKTRPNALFLSVVAQFNGQIATKIISWFRRLSVVSGLDDTGYRNYTTTRFVDGKYRKKLIELVKKLDIGVDDIFSEPVDLSNNDSYRKLSSELQETLKNKYGEKVVAIKTVHTKRNEKGKPVSSEVFDLSSNESDGTQKLFFLLGPILDTLAGGKVLFIDEMEARFHPNMTQALIQLFNSLESNSKRAQLVFSTHDTNLLSSKLLRRDQIWFVEKDQLGISHLYSLAELKVRNDASFEKDYIQGRYGAIPFIGGLEINNFDTKEHNDEQ